MLVNVLVFLWCGRQFLEITSSFFSLLSKSGFCFCISTALHAARPNSLDNILDNTERKCDPAVLCVLLKGLPILWCGLQFLEFILSLFFFPSRVQGFLFAISNCTDGFMHLSKQEMKPETTFITIAAQLRPVALKWLTYLHISTGSLFIHFGICVLVSFKVTVCYNHGVQ
jgi:hypothetical protein